MKALVIQMAAMSRNDCLHSITEASYKHNKFSESRSTLDTTAVPKLWYAKAFKEVRE